MNTALSETRLISSTFIVAVHILLCIVPNDGKAKSKGNSSAPRNSSTNQSELVYPFFVHDTRYFNNMSEERSGDPIKIYVSDKDQYSRVFMSPRESLVFDDLIRNLRSDDIVLDLGADVGTFSVTAARRGVAQVLTDESKQQRP
jgi:hypothetical protein